MEPRLKGVEARCEMFEGLAPLLKRLEESMALSSDELNAADELEVQVGGMKEQVRILSASVARETERVLDLNQSVSELERSAERSFAGVSTSVSNCWSSVSSLISTVDESRKKLREPLQRPPRATPPRQP